MISQLFSCTYDLSHLLVELYPLRIFLLFCRWRILENKYMLNTYYYYDSLKLEATSLILAFAKSRPRIYQNKSWTKKAYFKPNYIKE